MFLQEKLMGLWPLTWAGSGPIDDPGMVILKGVQVESSPTRIILYGEYGGVDYLSVIRRETLEALIPEDPDLFKRLHDLLKISTGLAIQEIGKAEI